MAKKKEIIKEFENYIQYGDRQISKKQFKEMLEEYHMAG